MTSLSFGTWPTTHNITQECHTQHNFICSVFSFQRVLQSSCSLSFCWLHCSLHEIKRVLTWVPRSFLPTTMWNSPQLLLTAHAVIITDERLWDKNTLKLDDSFLCILHPPSIRSKCVPEAHIWTWWSTQSKWVPEANTMTRHSDCADHH